MTNQEKDEQRITIEFPKGIDGADFMKMFLEQHPEHAENVRFEVLSPEDFNGVKLQSGQKGEIISTGEIISIKDNKFFNQEDVEIDIQHNGKNVYTDLRVLVV